MPVTRMNIWDLVRGPARSKLPGPTREPDSSSSQPTLKARLELPPQTDEPYVPGIENDTTYYPRTQAERLAFRTKAGKRVTPHQWAVYDFILNIPKGRVATYKSICDSLGQGSPRSVGSALRINPFAPYVPCHRVIASNLYLGGYCGEWGPQAKTGTQFNRKLQFLKDEGVLFDDHGILKSKESLW